MTTATDLAMNLADIRLRLRQVTDPFKGNDAAFDSGVEHALTELTLTIAQSAEATYFDAARKTRPAEEYPEKRHQGWLKKQAENDVRNRMRWVRANG